MTVIDIYESLFTRLKIYGKIFNYCNVHGEYKELENVISNHPIWLINYICNVGSSQFLTNTIEEFEEIRGES